MASGRRTTGGLRVRVVYELFKPLSDIGPTVYPPGMEVVDMHFESVKLLFDPVSIEVVERIA